MLKLKNKLFKIALITISLLGASLITSSAFAEDAPKADSEYPIKIQSNQAEFDDGKGTAIYTGDVIVDQGSRHLTAEKLTIYRGEDKKISSMIAIGNPARFQSQPNPQKPVGHGKAKTIKYYPNEDKADLIEDAELIQEGNTIQGPFLVYFFETGVLKSKNSSKQRTTVILESKKKEG
jgi:lipopolysaccharide export system protein LptA